MCSSVGSILPSSPSHKMTPSFKSNVTFEENSCASQNPVSSQDPTNRQVDMDAAISLLDQIVDIVTRSKIKDECVDRVKQQLAVCKELIESTFNCCVPREHSSRALVDKVPATYSLPFIPLSARRKSSAALTLGLQVPAFVTHQPSKEQLSTIPHFSRCPWERWVRRVGREWDLDMFKVHEETKHHSLVAIGECALSPILLSKSSRQLSVPLLASPEVPLAKSSSPSRSAPPASQLSQGPRLRRLTACAGSDSRDPILNKELQLRADVSLAMPDTVRQLLACLECNYGDVPYHSSVHAAQVAHHALCLAKGLHVWKLFPRAERAALIVAALAHDVGHCARTNRFLQHTSHRLTLVYNDAHVFENFHSAMLFTILEDNRYNVFHRCRQGEWDRVRRLIITAIIATDLQDHFETIARFNKRRLLREFDPASLASDRREVSCMIMKTADLSYLTLPWELTQMWTSRVYEEFWSQGDEEKLLGLPVSPLCNRKDKGRPKYWKDNASFCTSLVQPLFKELSDLYNNYCADIFKCGTRKSQDPLEQTVTTKSESESTTSTRSAAVRQAQRRRSVLLPFSKSEVKGYYENREFRAEIRKLTNKLHFAPHESCAGHLKAPNSPETTEPTYLDVLVGDSLGGASKKLTASSIADHSSEVLRLANPESLNDCTDSYYEDFLTNDDDASIAGEFDLASLDGRPILHSKSSLVTQSAPFHLTDEVRHVPLTVFCSERLKITAITCMKNYTAMQEN